MLEVLTVVDDLVGQDGGEDPGEAGDDHVVVGESRPLHHPTHHQGQADLHTSGQALIRHYFTIKFEIKSRFILIF